MSRYIDTDKLKSKIIDKKENIEKHLYDYCGYYSNGMDGFKAGFKFAYNMIMQEIKQVQDKESEEK